MLFLCLAAEPRMRVMSVILIESDTRVLETGNGIKMWSEPHPLLLLLLVVEGGGGGRRQVENLSRSLWRLSPTPQQQALS